MACSSSCRTQDHPNYGACLRAKNLRVSNLTEASGVSASTQKRVDKELDQYEKARAEGIQPRTTRAADVKAALSISDKTGEAFQA